MVEVAAAAFLRAGYGKNTFGGAVPRQFAGSSGEFLRRAEGRRPRRASVSPLDGERALSHKLSDSGARILVTSNLAALLPMALKFLDKGLLDRLIVCEDDHWGAVGNPHTPIPDHPGDRHLQDIRRRARPAGAVAGDLGRRRRAAAIYRRHHRPAQGRDAQPRQSDLGGVDLRRLGAARRAPSATPSSA